MEAKAKKALEKIEYRNRTWRSQVMKEQSIFDEILENICDGIDVEFWGFVMDLFKEKYRNNK